MAKNDYENKYHYLWAFLLGMALMVIIYVFFDVATDSEYRTRTNTSGDTTTAVSTQTGQTTDYVITTSTTEPEETVRAYLGVEVIDINFIIAQQLQLKNENGVLINQVFANSPAAAAGLKRTDVIESLNNKLVKDLASFKDIMSDLNPGDRVRIVYIRNGIRASAYALLVQAPASASTDTAVKTETSADDLGIILAPLTPALQKTYGLPSTIDGVIVLSVEPGGIADQAGLSTGDVITQIDKTPVTDLDDFFTAIEDDSNTTALMDVYSQGTMGYIALETSMLQVEEKTPAPISVYDRIFAVFTGGMPFGDDDEDAEEEGPKGGKFAPEEDENVTLTASDTSAFNRPAEPPGDSSSQSTSTSDTALNRPSSVPSQTSGSNNDTIFFIGLLLLLILYLGYREYNRRD